jgi:Bacterial extracellular solute-binding protein, family 7
MQWGSTSARSAFTSVWQARALYVLPVATSACWPPPAVLHCCCWKTSGRRATEAGFAGARWGKHGKIGGAEASFALVGYLPAPTTAVGNVTFFPKVNSLVINSKVLKGLTEDQRAVLHDAAQHTIDWAITATGSDANVAKEYCAKGGRIALASRADLASLQRAVQPVYQQLEQDAATQAMIARIRSLSGRTGPAPTAVKGC